VKQWEIIADNLRNAGWTLGWVSAVNRQGRTIWISDAHRGDKKRFIVGADEMLTALVELVYVPRHTHTVAWATLYDPLTGAAPRRPAWAGGRVGQGRTREC